MNLTKCTAIELKEFINVYIKSISCSFLGKRFKILDIILELAFSMLFKVWGILLKQVYIGPLPGCLAVFPSAAGKGVG